MRTPAGFYPNTLAHSNLTGEMIALCEYKPGEQGSETVASHLSLCGPGTPPSPPRVAQDPAVFPPPRALTKLLTKQAWCVSVRAAHPSEVMVQINTGSLYILDLKDSTEWCLQVITPAWKLHTLPLRWPFDPSDNTGTHGRSHVFQNSSLQPSQLEFEKPNSSRAKTPLA